MRPSNPWLQAALMVALLQAGTARADVVGPWPTDCPAGARPDVCHGAEYCGLASCIGPRDCAPGERCAARELCVGSRMCFGRGGPTTVSEVLSDTCSGCAARCESHFVCVGDAVDAGRRDAGSIDAGRDAGRDGGAMDAGDDDPRHSRYCGCSVPSRTEGIPTAAIALGGWLAITLMRRRQSSSSARSSTSG